MDYLMTAAVDGNEISQLKLKHSIFKWVVCSLVCLDLHSNSNINNQTGK